MLWHREGRTEVYIVWPIATPMVLPIVLVENRTLDAIYIEESMQTDRRKEYAATLVAMSFVGIAAMRPTIGTYITNKLRSNLRKHKSQNETHLEKRPQPQPRNERIQYLLRPAPQSQ